MPGTVASPSTVAVATGTGWTTSGAGRCTGSVMRPAAQCITTGADWLALTLAWTGRRGGLADWTRTRGEPLPPAADLAGATGHRFKLEFEIMKKANSPYILEVYNYNKDDNSYIMEYANITLFKYIEQNNTKLNLSERIGIINQIFKAFEYIHQNIGLHRDISTTNILLKIYDNDLLVVKISDFGLIKLKNSTLTSDNTDFKGSLNDPKLNIVGGFKNYSIEHETYALTRLIYFIVIGKTIIDNKFRNKDFESFIQNGISDDLARRYKNIQEMKIVFNKIKFTGDK